jgi:hypothetical protein
MKAEVDVMQKGEKGEEEGKGDKKDEEEEDVYNRQNPIYPTIRKTGKEKSVLDK